MTDQPREPTTIALPDDPAQDPQLGASGYPHEQELRRIREWPWEGGFRSLMAYIRDRWRYADAGYWEQQGDRFAISTGGWSGNESIIGALEQNRMFSMLCAWSWRRGGHYVYDVREWSEGPDGKRVLVRDPATPAIEAEAAADALRERDEAVRLLTLVAPELPMNQDEQGGCVWCGCSGDDDDYAGPEASDHADDCEWLAARTFLRRFEGEPG